MPDETPRPAKLPGDAPRELRDFVSCTTDRVRLDLGELGWLPTPKGLPSGVDPTPTVTIADGATSSSATINLGWAGGFISIDLPARIVDGELRVDASDIGFGIGDEVDEWTEAFNRTLRANGKQLDTFDVDGNRLTLTKKQIVAAEDGSATGAAGVAAVTTAGSTAGATDTEPAEKKSGCLAWVAGAAVAVLAAIGITLAVTSGGDDDTANTDTSGEPAPAVTEAPLATDAPFTSDAPDPSDPSVDDESPTTDETASADPADQPAQVCGDPDLLGSDDVDALLARFESGELGACGAPPDAAFPTCPFGDQCIVFDPIFVVGGTHGIDHSTQVVDARTEQLSASTARRELAGAPSTTRNNLWGDWFIVSDCQTTPKTGLVTLEPDATATAEMPLQFYGTCGVLPIERADGPFAGYRTYVAGEDTYVVDDPEPAPGAVERDIWVPFGDGFETGENSLTFDANVIQQVHAGGATETGCQWFFSPDDVGQLVQVLDQCGPSGNFWVFAAGLTDVEIGLTVTDTVAGTTATYVDPFDSSFAPVTDTDAFRTLYDNTVFPCGWGHLAYTACADGEPDMAATNLVTVAGVFPGDVPIEGDGSDRAHTIDFASTGGPTYTIRQDESGWNVESSSGATRARALIRGNSITLVAPTEELPGREMSYQWSTTVDGEGFAQPAVPVVGQLVPIVPGSVDGPADDSSGDDGDGSTTGGDDTDPGDADDVRADVEEFYEQLVASIASGDLGFSLDRLHPTVFEAYPDTCPAALESFTDPDFGVEVADVGASEDWTWTLPDGRSFEIADTLPVDIIVSGRGQSGAPSTAHLATIGGEYRWFTFC